MDTICHAGIILEKKDIKKINLKISSCNLVIVTTSSESKIPNSEIVQSFISEDCAKNNFHNLINFKEWNN